MLYTGSRESRQDCVGGAWSHRRTRPPRWRGSGASDARGFGGRGAEIFGRCGQPPVNAAVSWVDEKSAIRALDPLGPVLPLSPGRAEPHGFEPFRNGTF